MITALTAEVARIPHNQLAAALPHLRPFGTDESRAVREAFTHWLTAQRIDYPTWQQAWNAWTGALPSRPGHLAYTHRICPVCQGRRIDRRRGSICHTCMAGSYRRTQTVRTLALHQPDPGTPAPATQQTALPKAGDRIKITGVMDDPDPLPVGSTGTVTSVVAFTHGSVLGADAQICVDWDNGRTLMLVDTDPFVTE